MSVRKILIVNLTRFGDLLQTGPTIQGLKAMHPESEITVVVERNFADVCSGLPGIDRIWPLDLDQLGRLMLVPSTDGLRAAYAMMAIEIERLRAEQFDLALNYSSSRMSAILMRLIGVADTRGWTATSDGFRVISHQWSRLFSAACLNRRQAPFNLVDYYQRAAGVTAGPRTLRWDVPSAARAAAATFLTAAGWDGRRPLIAFQLGASRAVRRWPVASFVEVGRRLANRIGATIVLCGGKGERAFAEEIGAGLGAGEGVIDACGRTTIAELGGLLTRCDVLLTGDTGPMHMAVAVGTPVVSLFFGPALPVDTGPYAEDHLCLHAAPPCAPCDHNITCLDPFCRDLLEPEAVAEAVIARRAGDWAALAIAADRWAGFDWYRTTFDAAGFADVVRLGRRPSHRADVLRAAYRMLFLHEFDGAPLRRPGGALPAEAALLRELESAATLGAGLAAEVERLATAADDLAALEDAARRLEVLDHKLFRRGAMHDALTLLVQLFRFEKESLENADVDVLATATRVFHETLARRAGRLAMLLEPEAARSGVFREEECHASVA